MIDTFRRVSANHYLRWLIIAGTLLGASLFSYHPSVLWLAAVAVGLSGLLLMREPALGLALLIVVALVLPLEFNTGTEVSLNLAALLVPLLFVIWLFKRVSTRHLRFAQSRTTRPLVLFLLSGLLSLIIGNALWDPAVPRSDHFILVQLAQWAIFAFSALAFWLMANMITTSTALRRITLFFIALAGELALVFVLTSSGSTIRNVFTITFIRAPFWLLLVALVSGQLLFNAKLSAKWRILSLLPLGAVLVYAFGQQVERSSNWVSVLSVTGILIWLRWPRLGRFIVALLFISTLSGVLLPAVYNFAGGDAKWTESGGSREVLIQRVINVTLRNPITGLGPASYRLYANMEPLYYGGAYWVAPQINSHNNYVDIFAHTGVLGLGLFLWFMAEVLKLAWRLHHRYTEGFLAGYVNAMLAAWFGIMAIMLLADWFLPFVYNIGFPGFQASILVWMFFGGLVAIDNLPVTTLEDSMTPT
jgi:hypothetical protein